MKTQETKLTKKRMYEIIGKKRLDYVVKLCRFEYNVLLSGHAEILNDKSRLIYYLFERLYRYNNIVPPEVAACAVSVLLKLSFEEVAEVIRETRRRIQEAETTKA